MGRYIISVLLLLVSFAVSLELYLQRMREQEMWMRSY